MQREITTFRGKGIHETKRLKGGRGGEEEKLTQEVREIDRQKERGKKRGKKR